jgi:hypothetical protein
MNDIPMIAVVFLTAIGFFSLGALWQARQLIFWRIEWIKLEHDLAKAEKREPRKIDDYLSNVKRRYATCDYRKSETSCELRRG